MGLCLAYVVAHIRDPYQVAQLVPDGLHLAVGLAVGSTKMTGC